MMIWLTHDVVQEFLLSRGNLRTRSLEGYQRDLTGFEKAFPTDLPMKPQPIQAYFNAQHRQKGKTPLTPETVHCRYRSVRAMYRQLWIWHQDKLRNVANPMVMVRVPKPKPKPMRFWTQKEIYKFFCLDLTLREKAMLTLLIDVGPRASECAGLTWEDVVPEFITLSGKTGTRIVPISAITYHLLQELRQKPDNKDSNYVFPSRKGDHLTYWGIYHLVRKLCSDAGMSGRRMSPHTFRHTFGTYYAASEGCEPKMLQAIMGHKEYKTTLGYIQNNLILMSKNHARCTPLKDIAAAAQGNFFESRPVREAEAILTQKEESKPLKTRDK